VMDTGGLSATTPVTIQVLNVDRAPVFGPISNHVVLVGQPFHLKLPVTAPDADPMIFGVTGLPVGGTLDPNTGALDWTPTAALLRSSACCCGREVRYWRAQRT